MPHPDPCRVSAGIIERHRSTGSPVTIHETEGEHTWTYAHEISSPGEAREKATTIVTHMHIEREVNGNVAVVWVSTPDRVLELRDLLDADGLLPADLMETEACDAGFVDRRTGERVLRFIPAGCVRKTDWTEYRQISAAIDACHMHIDRHACKAIAELEVAEAELAAPQRRQPGITSDASP